MLVTKREKKLYTEAIWAGSWLFGWKAWSDEAAAVAGGSHAHAVLLRSPRQWSCSFVPHFTLLQNPFNTDSSSVLAIRTDCDARLSFISVSFLPSAREWRKKRVSGDTQLKGDHAIWKSGLEIFKCADRDLHRLDKINEILCEDCMTSIVCKAYFGMRFCFLMLAKSFPIIGSRLFWILSLFTFYVFTNTQYLNAKILLYEPAYLLKLMTWNVFERDFFCVFLSTLPEAVKH